MFSLAGKVAIVTGAGSVGPGWGNGKATAVLLARQGASVFAIDVVPAAVEETRALIEAEGKTCITHTCNMLDAPAVEAAVSACMQRFGRIDILVNAVGGSTIIADPATTTEALSLADWQALLHFNLTGTFLFTHAVIPVMRRQGSGKIVNLASIAGRGLSEASSSAYAAAKGGIIAFTKKLSLELGPHGINVNAIAPATTLTERIRPRWEQRPPEARARDVERTPLRRMGEAVDQARVICFLASADADFVTGLTIDVTGGL